MEQFDSLAETCATPLLLLLYEICSSGSSGDSDYNLELSKENTHICPSLFLARALLSRKQGLSCAGEFSTTLNCWAQQQSPGSGGEHTRNCSLALPVQECQQLESNAKEQRNKGKVRGLWLLSANSFESFIYVADYVKAQK
jgi:hypothetical protein